MKQKSNAKTVQTALDDLEYGPLHSKEAYSRVGKTKIPEGVNQKRLMRDITLIAWPSFVELLLTQLTSMADQIMVDHPDFMLHTPDDVVKHWAELGVWIEWIGTMYLDISPHHLYPAADLKKNIDLCGIDRIVWIRSK